MDPQYRGNSRWWNKVTNNEPNMGEIQEVNIDIVSTIFFFPSRIKTKYQILLQVLL